MKRLFSLVTLTLVLVLALASCSVINSVIGLHTVTFDLNGGVGGEDFSESVNVFDGKTVKLPTPTKEEYTFDGWFNGEELFTAESTVFSDLTLTAKWHPNKVTVSFVDYFGNLVSTETVDYGSSVTAPAVDAVIGNQKFIEWDKDLSSVTEDITVKAVYGDNVFTITYDLGNIAEGFAKTCFMGELPKIPETPIIEGYVFSGWFLDEELTDRYFFDYKLDRDVTLYAKLYDTSLGEYIVISNLDQLMAIKDQPDANYLLACDINCKGETLTPIDEFSGELEGNGYKIFNFTINENGISTGFIRTNNGAVNNLSFGDFTFDILIGTADYKYYGIVAAINNGTITNCHVIDSELKLQSTVSIASSANFAGYIGGIVGQNNGSIVDCSNKLVINVSVSTLAQATYYGCSVSSTYYIGGICGYNSENAILNGCANYGKIDSLVYSAGSLYTHNYHSAASAAYTYAYIGGLTGYNVAEIDSSVNTAEIDSEIKQSAYYSAAYGYVGGLVGLNNGKCTNDYATGNIQQSGNSDVYVGGFVAYNKGKTYNCYSTTNIDINDSSAIIKSVGGFAGENILENGYEATINKCFSTGSITLGKASTDSGYFVGRTTGTEKDCYYLDTMTINIVTKTEITDGETTETVETVEAVNPTCAAGEAKTFDELTSADFIENTLYFDRMIWLVVDGELPTLR